MDAHGYLSPAVAGSGSIAAGLAAAATTLGEVRLLARSDKSAWRAEEQVEKLCGKLDGADHSKLRVTTSPADLAGCDVVVEAVIEEQGVKVDLLASIAEVCPDSDLATTTSSLSITEIGEGAGIAERFYGLHVFNPVTKMELVELCLPDGLAAGVGERARGFCEVLGKRAIEVPDRPGFVVNRLLFPYLFDAVRLLEDLDLEPEQVDACMSLGASQPMGPLALLDFVGIDVAVAIGEGLYRASEHDHHHPPKRLLEMADAGLLGRKSGQGFYEY